jgi:hypothetical protein
MLLFLNYLVCGRFLYGESKVNDYLTLSGSRSFGLLNDRFLEPISLRLELAPSILIDFYDDTVGVLVFGDGRFYDLAAYFILTWA